MKERYEWIHSWSDEANKDDLPRVLLIGDYITYSYQEKVRENLKGKYYVDYIATSYAIDSPFYYSLIAGFVNDNVYSIIHFNNGLHGIHIEKDEYKKLLEDLIKSFKPENKKIILLLLRK